MTDAASGRPSKWAVVLARATYLVASAVLLFFSLTSHARNVGVGCGQHVDGGPGDVMPVDCGAIVWPVGLLIIAAALAAASIWVRSRRPLQGAAGLASTVILWRTGGRRPEDEPPKRAGTG